MPEEITKIDQLTYEEAIAELETIVKQLESGEAKLAESAELYERGVELAKHCSAILKSMEEKISKLQVNEEGEIIEGGLYL